MAKYRIRLPDFEPFEVAVDVITNPNLLKAIQHMESKPGCTGVSLDDGTTIEKTETQKTF